MKNAYIKTKSGTTAILKADRLSTTDDDRINVFCDDSLIGTFMLDTVEMAYLTEQRGNNHEPQDKV